MDENEKPPEASCIGSSDLLDEFDKCYPKGGTRLVTWQCPAKCKGGVTWDFSATAYATCNTCGQKSIPSKEI